MSGMNRVIAYNNRQDVISLEEGNKAVSFNFYKTLCDILHQGKGEDFLVTHAFLQWNGI